MCAAFSFPAKKRVKTSEGKQIRNFPEASRGDLSMISGREMMMFKSFRGRQTSLCHKNRYFIKVTKKSRQVLSL